MSTSAKHRFLLLVVFLTVPGLLLAQSPGAAVSGEVRDPSGSVVAGVSLEARCVESGVTYTAQTDESGRYEFRRLAQGRYRIRASYRGFQPSMAQDVLVSGSQTVSLDLTLQVEEVRQVVIVTGEAAPLDLSTTNTSSIIGTREMSSLPIAGRSLEQVALLAPGTIPVRAKDARGPNGFTKTISSSGSRGVTFLLDGLNIQHAIFADETPGGVSGLLLGMESVAEFEVISDAYPAFVAGGGGPVINVLSRRGTRELHGSLFEYYRNEALDARNFFDTTKPDLSRHQFGGAVGGPLPGRGITFFASYEGLHDRNGRTFFNTVPDERARLGILPDGPVTVSPAIKPILDLYPMPNGENFGDGTAVYAYQKVLPTDDHHLNLRTDVDLSPRDSLMARYTLQNSSRVAPLDISIEGFDNALDSRNHYLSVEHRRILSSRWINTLQVGLNRSGYSSVSTTRPDLGTVDPLIPGRNAFGRLNIRSLSSFGTDTADLSFTMNQLDVTDTMVYSNGRHDWTFGFNWKNYRSDGTYDFFFNGLLIYDNLRSFLTNRTQRFNGATADSDARKRYRQHLFAFYIQDQVRWRPDLTVSFGLRYEPFTVPTEADGKMANLRDLFDPAPTIGPMFENPSATNVGPRVGLAWNVGGSDRTVLRSGFGVFFDPIRENIFGYGARVQTPFVSVVTVNAPPYPDPFSGRAGPPREDNLEYDLRTPYMMRYHLMLQHELAHDLVGRIGYVGSRGVHLPRVGDINTPAPIGVDDQGLPYFAAGRAQRTNPTYERIRYTSTDANSFYNELQLGLTRRFKQGLQFGVNYSFSRSIDDASAYRRSFTNSVADVPPYYFDRTLERGLSNFHIAHNATFHYTWDIPFKGSGSNIASHLFRNWQSGGVLALSSGYPFSLNVSFDIANNTIREGHRPNLAAGASNNPVLGGPNEYFDVSAFELQQAGHLGNLGRNTLIGPGYASLDLMLLRQFRMAAGQALQLRLEVYNVLNRANFAAPQNSGTGGVILFNDTSGQPVGNAARIFSTIGPARQLQLGIRWTF